MKEVGVEQTHLYIMQHAAEMQEACKGGVHIKGGQRRRRRQQSKKLRNGGRFTVKWRKFTVGDSSSGWVGGYVPIVPQRCGLMIRSFGIICYHRQRIGILRHTQNTRRGQRGSGGTCEPHHHEPHQGLALHCAAVAALARLSCAQIPALYARLVCCGPACAPPHPRSLDHSPASSLSRTAGYWYTRALHQMPFSSEFSSGVEASL